ncbi:DeoR/GlpR family DNA-binding transcription regulator [Catenisphaera adipataccumulans]|uniref:Lactose phosphotransferase system repressor n=1 Tax=Catenisphaera adipataccumulans TaxID=700500 RepID=A0A7W8CZE5_9FIRM|nr:DeoR/GlpR family DNA-binding transcription regulator [Catenisphaera adipataccumulans]MBB5183154.1 DeoR family fructose operon transcriptional repressor [Catenisphaera adipataccumulans]
MTGKERKNRLIAQLQSDHILYTNELVRSYQVSEATIRRDLHELEQQGKLKRINGGAIPVNPGALLTPDKEVFMQRRFRLHADEKRRVCQAAAQEVQDGDCIFIDGGTSLMYLIDYIKQKPVTIVTHNHLVPTRIVENSACNLFVVGGRYAPKYAMSVGTSAIRQIQDFFFDKCFVGCAGLDIANNLAYTAELETRDIKIAAMKNSRHSSLLIDASKLNVLGSCRFCALDEFDTIYCNQPEEDIEFPENFQMITMEKPAAYLK